MKKLAAAAALAGAVALVAPAMPADAATRTIHDKVGDGRHNSDMTYVRVHYGPDRIKFRIQWAAGSMPADHQIIFVDTKVNHPGPEFAIEVTRRHSTLWVGSITDWLTEGWKQTWIGKGYYSADHGGSRDNEFVRGSIPRTAIKQKGHAQPRRIRVSVNNVSKHNARRDAAPGAKKWSGWINWR